MTLKAFLFLALTLALASTPPTDGHELTEKDANEPRQLPAGNAGIAAQYPGDVGIDRCSDVVFVESFDDDLDSVMTRWDTTRGKENLSLSTDVPSDRGGKYSLLVTHVGGRDDGSHLYRRLPPGYNKLHYRFYVKFGEACAPIHHFFHVGGYHPATAWPQGGAGQRPDGNERFTTGVEPFGKHWQWDYYSYWMNMRGSPPRGQCWGNSFIHNTSAQATKRTWQCLELMMKLNEVGDSNGEMALWLDGRQLSHLGKGFPKGMWEYDKFRPGRGGPGVRWSDERKGPMPLRFPTEGAPFEGFEWRTDKNLNLNFLWLLCYITESEPRHVSKIWFDHVVVAKEYIGPIEPR